ncbi:uncharacterized protein LOC143584484 [Bidens hawaiensis]|uniref:uncharacterized protein LOC143584484 n=1 Tax=Bidens hawaiensis TaxID=980011 RepID=UPI004049324C
MADSKLSLKLIIDKKGQRVLFAEANKDLIDFLFSLLVLPVGSIIKLLDNREVVGGLAKLYQSVSDLKDDYIQPNQNKNVLLNPKSLLPFSSSHISLLVPTDQALSSPTPTDSKTVFYTCEECDKGCFSTSYCTSCPYCEFRMRDIDDRYVLKSEADAKGGGFVKGSVTYMVMDDLSVSSMPTIANIALLNKFNIKDWEH